MVIFYLFYESCSTDTHVFLKKYFGPRRLRVALDFDDCMSNCFSRVLISEKKNDDDGKSFEVVDNAWKINAIFFLSF